MPRTWTYTLRPLKKSFHLDRRGFLAPFNAALERAVYPFWHFYRGLTLRDNKGITLVTAIIALALLGVSAGVAIIFSSQLSETRRERLTRDELEVLQQAITGNPRLIIQQGRADFGFVGNMGSIPATLEDLYRKGTQPAFAFDTTKNVGAGWAGPYIAPFIIENLDSLKKDTFGNDYEYTTTPYTRSDGEVVSARIRSIGPDDTSGTSDDREIEVLRREVFSTVTGKVVDKTGAGQKNTAVTLNLPENGSLTTRTAVTDASGSYQFTDVSFGLRSVSISPKLSYADGSAKLLPAAKKNDLSFTVVNSAQNAVTITSITAVYNITAFYETIKIGTTTVFNYASAGGVRGASGDTKTFASQTIAGSGVPVEATVLRVESDSATAPDIVVGGQGGSLKIEYNGFKNVQTGGGSTVNMSGVTFTITFSDGSEITFTT